VFEIGVRISSFKTNLGITWLRDESFENSDNFPEPDFLVREIMEELKVALEQFSFIAVELGEDVLHEDGE
jgi:hypothetical protein